MSNTDRTQFIKDPAELRKACHRHIAELRVRIPVVDAVHACLTDLQAKKSVPTRRWIDVLYKALLPGLGAGEFFITGFEVTKPMAHLSHGYVKFVVEMRGFDPLRFSVHYTNDGVQPDTALIGYAQDEAIANALEAKLPLLDAAVTRYNDALAELCAASNFCVNTSLGTHCNIYPLSSAFHWYELAGDTYKSMELRKRGIFVR